MEQRGGGSSGFLTSSEDSFPWDSLYALQPSEIDSAFSKMVKAGEKESEHRSAFRPVVQYRDKKRKKKPSARPTPPNPNNILRRVLSRAIWLIAKSEKMAITAASEILTQPSGSALNDGHDNIDSDLIVRTNDIIPAPRGEHLRVRSLLGKGAFGQVFCVENLQRKQLMALKIIRNQPSYYSQAIMEVRILRAVAGEQLKSDHHVVRFYGCFLFHNHLCLMFELLGMNLFEVLQSNEFRGLSMSTVRIITKQLVDALSLLHDLRIIHCDLKPENVLLLHSVPTTIRLIDFGSACVEGDHIYSYIQSRFYRAPEVLLGTGYQSSIDIWSLGCVLAELFIGIPLFPGASQFDQISRITKAFGLPPEWMVRSSKFGANFFHISAKRTKLMSKAEYCRLNPKEADVEIKKYFRYEKLDDLILKYPMTDEELANKAETIMQRRTFLHFLKGLLQLDPQKRWTPLQALTHPFLTNQPFDENFEPEYVRSERKDINSSLSRWGSEVWTVADDAELPFVGSSIPPVPGHMYPHRRQSVGGFDIVGRGSAGGSGGAFMPPGFSSSAYVAGSGPPFVPSLSVTHSHSKISGMMPPGQYGPAPKPERKLSHSSILSAPAPGSPMIELVPTGSGAWVHADGRWDPSSGGSQFESISLHQYSQLPAPYSPPHSHYRMSPHYVHSGRRYSRGSSREWEVSHRSPMLSAHSDTSSPMTQFPGGPPMSSDRPTGFVYDHPTTALPPVMRRRERRDSFRGRPPHFRGESTVSSGSFSVPEEGSDGLSGSPISMYDPDLSPLSLQDSVHGGPSSLFPELQKELSDPSLTEKSPK